MGDGWTDSGWVFTREDGSPLRNEWVSVRFAALAAKAGLPPIRFNDLRHGSASLLPQVSRSRSSPTSWVMRLARSPQTFTPRWAEELADSAASAIAAFIPRRRKEEDGDQAQ